MHLTRKKKKRKAKLACDFGPIFFIHQKKPMGKNDFLTTKAVANRIKAKGAAETALELPNVPKAMLR